MTLLSRIDLKELSEALQALGVDGWLIYDFHGINPVARRVLGHLGLGTRRLFVWLPASGRPVAIVHKIELQPLRDFPGEVRPYATWQELHGALGTLVRGKRMAAEWSPEDAVPYLDRLPAGVVELLHREGIAVEGRRVVVVGRSTLVGRPLSILLSQKGPGLNATVTLCHTGTKDLGIETRRAEILIVAAGHAGAITADMVMPGSVVVDVGTNNGADGKLVGDVDFERVSKVVEAITPVPGGVGPMTIAMLLDNTVRAAERATSATP